jgi:hypothetical protein
MKVKVNIWVILFLVIIAIGGYVLAYIQYDNNIVLQKEYLKDDMAKIGIIDDELENIRDSKKITIDDLIKSKERLEKILDTMGQSGVDSLTLDEALKIIEQ